ncbi:ectoine hydroxylase [Streptomyces sp. NPDC048281]|uniref:ectoine hydroxylase n=1 Tax=Streptomyces sp. NPDC048281 TaxID=3154715 RepID=UPI00343D3687
MTGAAKPGDQYPTRLSTTAELLRREPVVWTSPGRGPIDSDALEAYERDGFLVFGDLFNDDEVQCYQAEADRLLTDATMLADERTVVEPSGGELRSIFEVHTVSPVFAELVADPRLLERARQILDSEVYIHQSRINLKPGFGSTGFYWHSDFETWHAEDGMPVPRALSFSIALTENLPVNGPLMIMPGSHRTFVGCEGDTPLEHFRLSLRRQEIGTPSTSALARLAERFGISQVTGRAGAVTVFDSNCMHGSSDNITPYPRRNVFVVYNSVENSLVEPFSSPARRPEFIASRDFTPVRACRRSAAHG